MDCIYCSLEALAVTSVLAGDRSWEPPPNSWYCKECRVLFSWAEEAAGDEPLETTVLESAPDAWTASCECGVLGEKEHESDALHLLLAHWEATGHERFRLQNARTGRSVGRTLTRDEKIGWRGSETPPGVAAG